MKFVEVRADAPTLRLLYQLLEEREDNVNISHSKTSWDDHVAFVNSNPYSYWYVIHADGHRVGAIYLTRQNEIGVFILKEHQGRGYGPVAVNMMMTRHLRERFLANINPANQRSIKMFERLGFKHIQNTYEMR